MLGAWDDAGEKAYYIRQAYPDGGIVFSTGDDAWRALEVITDPVVERQTRWALNRRFLEQQMDAGVGRFEYVSSDFNDILTRYSGQSYDDVLNDFVKYGENSKGQRISYRELELLYLRDNASRLGYDLVDTTWVKR